MKALWDLIADNSSAGGKVFSTAVIVAVAVAGAAVLGRLLARRVDDRYRKYYARKIAHYVVYAAALIATAMIWRPFAGQLGLMLGLITAGVAFALQEVIGAVAGWFNILSGQIFRVGDRVQLGGVRGDVIDITPLRTKLMEIGSGVDGDSWVRGRQYTGRIVVTSNRASFADPVFNYSATFEFLWEEITFPISYRDRWRAAEQILLEEAVRVSSTAGAVAAIAAMVDRYPVARTEVEPRVFIRATDNYIELTARFVVPVRTARHVKSDLTRTVLARLEDQGISVASATQDVTIHAPTSPPGSADGGSMAPDGVPDSADGDFS